MHITRSLSATDQKKVKSFLDKDDSVYLNWSLLQEVPKSAARRGQFWVSMDEDKSVTGVLCLSQAGRLFFYCPDSVVLDFLMSAFIRENSSVVSDFFGPFIQAVQVMKMLQIKCRHIKSNFIYGLETARLVEQPLRSTERVGSASVEILPFLTRWCREYAVEAMATPPEVAAAEAEDRARLFLNTHLFIIGDMLECVALVSYSDPRDGIISLEHMWTPKEYRNRGYAKRLVSHTIKAFRDRMHVRKVTLAAFSSVPAKKVYEKLGFEHQGDIMLGIYGGNSVLDDGCASLD